MDKSLNEKKNAINNPFPRFGKVTERFLTEHHEEIFHYLISLVENGVLEIPSSMPVIPARLFDGTGYIHGKGGLKPKAEAVRAIRAVMIPSSVRSIGFGAFRGCQNLSEVILSEGIQEIAPSVFSGCVNLKTICLPHSLKKVNGRSFYQCGLTDPLFSADGEMLIYYPVRAEASEYTVPCGVKVIGAYAFDHAEALYRVTLPEGLKRIASRAFERCALGAITIPARTEVERGAFSFFDHPLELRFERQLDVLDARLAKESAMGHSFLCAGRMRAPRELYHKTAAFSALAAACAEGKTEAMEKMADIFFQKAKEASEDHVFYECAASFWAMRAYLYGSLRFRAHWCAWVEVHPEERPLSPGIDETLCGSADGALLRALGFLFFDENRAYCLSGTDTERVVEVSSWESDEGPDSDGFGREEYYDWWYLDEFLTLPFGEGYIHSFSHNDKRCNEKRFLALHDSVAARAKAKKE